jgi:hypothetical protein
MKIMHIFVYIRACPQTNNPDGDYRMLLHRIHFHTGRLPVLAVCKDTSSLGASLLSPHIEQLLRKPSLQRYLATCMSFQENMREQHVEWLSKLITVAVHSVHSTSGSTRNRTPAEVDAKANQSMAHYHSQHEPLRQLPLPNQQPLHLTIPDTLTSPEKKGGNVTPVQVLRLSLCSGKYVYLCKLCDGYLSFLIYIYIYIYIFVAKLT